MRWRIQDPPWGRVQLRQQRRGWLIKAPARAGNNAVEAASGSIQFNRKSAARPKTGNKAKEGAETNAVADTEDDGIRYGAGVSRGAADRAGTPKKGRRAR